MHGAVLIWILLQAGTVHRRFWEPYHEARKLAKMLESVRLDLLQLHKKSKMLHEAAAQVRTYVYVRLCVSMYVCMYGLSAVYLRSYVRKDFLFSTVCYSMRKTQERTPT